MIGKFGNMYRPILLLMTACALAGCSPSPKGVTVRVLGNEVIVTLDEAGAVQIRQNMSDSCVAAVAHLDGKLQITQLEKGGNAPRSLILGTGENAEFNVMSRAGQPASMIVDQDGDGLPDFKLVGNKKYKRGAIEWIEINGAPDK